MQPRSHSAFPGTARTARWEADTDRWPLVELRITHPDQGSPQVQQLLEAFDALVARRAPYGLVWDLHGVPPSASRRQQVIRWFGERWKSSQSSLVSAAVVTPSSLQRNMATAFLWFVQPPCPVKMFADVTEARAWTRLQLEGRGLQVPV